MLTKSDIQSLKERVFLAYAKGNLTFGEHILMLKYHIEDLIEHDHSEFSNDFNTKVIDVLLDRLGIKGNDLKGSVTFESERRASEEKFSDTSLRFLDIYVKNRNPYK